MSIFTVSCTPEKSFDLFFKYRYVNVSKKVIDSWDPSEFDLYIRTYKLIVCESVFDNASEEIRNILLDIISEDSLVEMKHPIHPSQTWFRAFFPLNVISAFKRIFISTLVYHYQDLRLPKPESVTFTFDTDEGTIAISSLDTYVPDDNPYYKYAQNAAVLMSAEAIGLCDYQIGDDKIRDFYDPSRITKWKECSNLEKEQITSDRPGVYMLYDQYTNRIYVGKAKRLVERIIQHTRTPNDTMADFTHYRYSGISEEYFEFLYLIENSAIHDVAWIMDMPAAKKYKPPLVAIVTPLGQSIQDCTLANTVEHQTRKQ